jgi:hypothetical protein
MKPSAFADYTWLCINLHCPHAGEGVPASPSPVPASPVRDERGVMIYGAPEDQHEQSCPAHPAYRHKCLCEHIRWHPSTRA